jgi:hypothetical protein
MPNIPSPVPKRKAKDLRLRDQVFPGAEDRIFDTEEKGFVPVPILFRKLLRHLSPPQSRLLLYLQLRCSRFGICYPSLEEIAHDLGLSSRKKLTPHLNALIENKFIESELHGGKKFFLMLHPRFPILHLYRKNRLTEDEVFEIEELLRDLKQPVIKFPPKGGKA